ncbi:iron ABC transporter substrate-binding protein [Pseudonocardia aurantiaca]|uniref:ABC transporter substrate-binding protein n=1 Tax=Pseudonocardia aurantiaca TaxID=75290 RepID=A0ABW4FT73_9PSEU
MSRRPSSRRPLLVGIGTVLALSLAVACGSPTSGGGSAGGGTTAADGVYAEVGPMTGDERRARLVELAAQEGKTLSIYTSLNADIADIVIPAFEQQFGIHVELYRADSETILQRTLQESSANFAGADIVETNANEMAVIAGQGLTGDYEGEQRNKVNEQFRYDAWTPTRFNIFAPAWNTQRVSGDLIPKSWLDLADPKYDGLISLEVGDYDWYMTLYGYLQKQGMSDSQIDQYFADLVHGAKISKGHSGQVELLSAGEFGVVAASYSYLTAKARTAGAPVDDQPFVQPVIARANGGGPLRSAVHPGTAMLFMDWFLEEGQALILDNGLTPAVMPDGTDPLGGLQVEPVDAQKLVDEGRNWSDRYDQLVQGGEQVASN